MAGCCRITYPGGIGYTNSAQIATMAKEKNCDVIEVAFEKKYKREDGMLYLHENMPPDCWVTRKCKCTLRFCLHVSLIEYEVSEYLET
jgi:hypothetical protein